MFLRPPDTFKALNVCKGFDDFKVSEDALIQLKLKKTDEKKLAKIFR